MAAAKQVDAEGDVFRRAIFRQTKAHETNPTSKVSVIGCGNVGSATVYALLAKNLCGEIAVVDIDEAKLNAEMMDLGHAAVWSKTKIYSSTDLNITKDSKICIVTATVHDEDHRIFLQGNVAIFQTIIPQIVRHSPSCVLLIVTNPVETMTYVAWKLSQLPSSRVLGAGTVLDSAQFRWALARRLGVHSKAVKGVLTGAHEGALVFNWRGVHVSGTPIKQLKRNIDRDQATIANELKQDSKAIFRGKGYNSWGVALSIVAICKAILLNTLEILPASIYIKGCRHSEADSDVFMSMSCVVCQNGVHSVVRPQYSDEERVMMVEVAKQLLAVQKETMV